MMKALCTSGVAAAIEVYPPANNSALIPFRDALSAACENMGANSSFLKLLFSKQPDQRGSLSYTIKPSNSGMCRTVARMSHFARAFVLLLAAHRHPCTRPVLG